jgi:protein O-GlcNAc transferase
MKVFITRVSVLLLCICSAGFAQKPKDDGALERIFNQAMQALQAGSYPEAEKDLRQILHADPDNPAALVNLGVLYSRTRRYTEAADAYKHALRMVPAQESVQLNLGLAYLKQNHYEQALPYFSHLHDLHPDDAQFAILTATCLTYTGKASQAIDLLQPLTVSGIENRAALYVLGIAYMRANQPEKARAALVRVFAEAPASQASFLLGEAYAQATDYPAAAEAFRAVLASDPAYPGAHRELGRTYLGMHQNLDAERELRLAVKADPTDVSALYSLGAMLVESSRFSDGRTFLEQSQKVAPDSWATAFYLGKAEYELHDMLAAEKQLRHAAELNPDEPGAPYLLARILSRQGHTEEANQWMQRVAALHATALDAEKRAVEKANRESRQDAVPAP